MTTISWKNAANADWTTGAAWVGNVAPTTGNDAIVDIAGAYTVTIAAAEAVTVHSATLNDAGATLAVKGRLTLAGTAPSLAVEAGAVLLSGTIAGGTIQLGANALSTSGAALITGALDAAGGVIALATGSTLTLANGGSLDTLEEFNGPGTLATAGALTVGSGGIALDGSLVWNNSGTVSSAAQINTDYPSSTGTVTINNLAGAAFDLTVDGAGFYVGSTTTFNNAGVLAKTGGTGASTVVTALNNTGTISATSGTLELDGGGTFGAKNTITGAGTVAVNSGTFTLAGSAATVTGRLALTGGVVQVDAGKTLTLAGTNAWGNGTQIDGPGTLFTTGATGFTTSPQLDGNLVWINAGTVSAGVQLDTDYPSGAGTMTVDNQVGAVFDLTADGNAIYVGSTTDLTNAGLLSKTGGTGTSAITDALVNIGTLTATTGTLELDGGGTLGGKIGATGSGQLAFGGGTFTVGAAAQTITGPLAITGGLVQLDAGKILTLSGATTLANGTQINGPGTLQTTGATGFVSTPQLDGSLVWINSGSVTADAQLDTDYPSVAGAVTINNLAGGLYNITTDAGIYVGAATTRFNNTGTLEKTGGVGVSPIFAAVANSGTLAATTGTLELDGGGTLNGKIVEAGTGAVQFGGGAFAFSGAVAVTGTLTFDNGATLAVGAVSGTISSASVLESAVTIAAGKTLTLTGPTTWGAGTQINGPGTLQTTGATSFIATPQMDGNLVWNNSGTVNAGIQLDTDYPSGAGAMVINNQASGAIDFTADGNAIYVGSTTDLNNVGTIAKTGGSGTSPFVAVLNNTGTIGAATGTLELDGGGTFGATNTITGAGVVSINDGIFTLAGTTAEITGALAMTGGIVQIDAGKTLTLSGANAWGAGTQIDGPGTLQTTGATSFLSTPQLDGNLVWNNSGTVNAGIQLDTDYPSGTGTMVINNQTGGKFNFTADGNAIYVGATTDIDNAGVLAKTGGTGTSIITDAVNNTSGSITATIGTLELDGGGTLDGTEGGTGNGVVVLGNGAAFVTGGLDAFVPDDGVKNGLRVVNGATWTNSGIIETEGHIQLGNASGTSALVITALGDLHFLSDDGGIVNGGGGTLTNAGQIAKTAGSGTSVIGMGFTNTGTVEAESGTLKLSAGVAGTGNFRIDAAATLELANGAVAGGNTISMTGLGATLRIDTNSTVAKPIVGLGAGSRIDLAAASSVAAVISGNTLTVTPNGGSALNFVSTTSLANLIITKVGDGGTGTVVSLAVAPPPLVTLAAAPSASNATGATLGTVAPGLAGDALSVTLNSDDDFASGSSLALNNGTLLYTPGLVIAGQTSAPDTLKYTVTDTVTGAVTKETQTVALSNGPAPIVTLAAAPTASNTASAKLGTAVTGHAADALSVSLTSDADFASGSTVVLNNGTLIYTPGVVTAAMVGPDTIRYVVQDKATGAGTTETQVVTLSTGSPPVVTLAATPTASNSIAAKLGTAAPGVGTDALSVTLNSDADFATGSKIVLNNGTLSYTPGLVTAALVGADTIKYTVTDTATGASTPETQTVTLSNGPGPVVTLAAAPAASNVATATLGTATPGHGSDALSVSLTSDADFATGSKLVLNNGTLVYTPGLVTAAKVGADTIKYTVTDTVTGAVTAETQTVTLSNGAPPIVTFAATPSASNAASGRLGTAAPGVGTDALSVTLTSDADFATGSKIVLNNGTLTYTPGLVTAALVGSDIIKYTVTDTVTGGTTPETQTVTLSNAPAPIVILAAAPAASNAVTATLGTAVTGHGTDALSVSLTSDADFATGSKIVLNNGTLVYTPGLVTAAKVGSDTIKYTVADTATGAVTTETQTVTLSNGPAPVVTLAATPSATNATSAKLGTATPGHGSDALSVSLTSDADFATGSKLVLNNGTLLYTPGIVTAAKVGADTIKYTVTDTATGAATAKTQVVTLGNAPGPIVTLAATPMATNTTSAILGSAKAGVGTDALSLTLTADADFATGSKLMLSNGNLVYTAGAITLAKAGSDSIGYTVTDTVTGAVTKETQSVTIIDSILTLTVAPTTVLAAQQINTFIAPAGALNSRDNLTGGPNTPNTLDLTGGGAFDLNAPKTLANIQIVNASEGQAAFVSGATNIASTAQVVFLRDGVNVDLVVGAGTPNASNPNPRGILIYGGTDGSVINFGTGSDTMVLGSVTERVVGGTGTGLVQATAALAGAQVSGAATGTTTLEISGGGTAALNANDTHITVKLDAATVLTLSKAAFVIALGSSGADSITAGATGQVLSGGAGADTLTGFSGFGDTFSGTSAALNGDLIKLFGGSDLIDLTDMGFASLKPLAFAGGVLTVADGTHTSKISFAGSYGVANFHPATDTHTGTLISFGP